MSGIVVVCLSNPQIPFVSFNKNSKSVNARVKEKANKPPTPLPPSAGFRHPPPLHPLCIRRREILGKSILHPYQPITTYPGAQRPLQQKHACRRALVSGSHTRIGPPVLEPGEHRSARLSPTRSVNQSGLTSDTDFRLDLERWASSSGPLRMLRLSSW